MNEHPFKALLRKHGHLEPETPGGTYNPDAPVVDTDDPGAAKWVQAMLGGSCQDVAATQKGSRNDTLYRKAFRVGTFIAGGYLDELTAHTGLTDAAKASGLPPTETLSTVQRAFRDARNSPAVLQLDELPEIPPAYVLEDENGDPIEEMPAQEQPISSWEPVDLGPILDGTWEPPKASLLFRDDGQGLMYPGHVHWWHGESESGKSWVLQAAVAKIVASGGDGLYVDHESNAAEVVGRLLSMGVDAGMIRKHFMYISPDVPVQRAAESFVRLLESEFAIVVIDGVTDAIGLDGTSTKDNDEIAAWMRRVPGQLARHTGAAVNCIDHVSKDAEGRGRFAIGGQHKMAGVDGAAYVVEPVEPLGKGVCGSLKVKIAKDRPGDIRPTCGRWNTVTRTQEAARVVVDSSAGDGSTVVTVYAPDGSIDDTGKPFRPTELMERVSRFVEEHPGSGATLIKQSVRGKDEMIVDVIALLVDEGYVERQQLGQKMLHYATRPFRNRPESDWPEGTNPFP